MSARNSAYSPLSQFNSDSEDSSDELPIANENSIINRVSKVQLQDSEATCNGQPANTINCKLLDTEGDFEATLIRFQPATDEVSILKATKKLQIFSTTRKLCFILSLLLCVFTTVVFVWFLPCNAGTCLSVSHKNKILMWKKTLEGLELFGPISTCHDSSKIGQNLVFFTRKPTNDIEHVYKTEAGLISFRGENGKELWNINITGEPSDIDCNLVDLNLDGHSDCLLFGTATLIAINSITGSVLWDAAQSNRKNFTISHMSEFPLITYDVDDDNINDLLLVCSFSNIKKKKNTQNRIFTYFSIISGKTGVVINSPLYIDSCRNIENLMFENNSTISYICHNPSGKESLQTMKLSRIMGKELTVKESHGLHQHLKKSNSIHVNNYKIVMDNQGQCPENCQVLIDIKQGSNNQSVYTNIYKNAFGVAPSVLNRSGSTSLLLKVWKWQSKEAVFERRERAQSKYLVNTKWSKTDGKLKSLKTLENAMILEDATDVQRFKRAANYNNSVKSESNPTDLSSDVRLHIISETIVVINLTTSHPSPRNVTHDEIIQLCRKPHSCQPEINDQKRSLLIADLNGDGKDEFVSFSSKYVPANKSGANRNDDKWLLQSVIKVVTV